MGNSYPKPQLRDGVKPCGGKSMIPVPSAMRNAVYWSIAEAERLLGYPANTPQICVVFQ